MHFDEASESDSELLGRPRRRGQRRPPPPLTPAQREVLSIVARSGMATIEQVRRERLPRIAPDGPVLRSYSGTARLLEILASAKEGSLLSWCRWINLANHRSRRGNFAGTYIYSLSPMGAKRCILDREMSPDTPHIVRPWRGAPAFRGILPHCLGIVDMLSAFRVAVRDRPGYALEDTWADFLTVPASDPKRRKTYRKPVTEELYADGRAFIPDSTARIVNTSTGKSFALFGEFERTNRADDVVAEKFVKYRRSFTYPGRRFKKGTPILLYAVSDADRIAEILKLEESGPLAPALRLAHIDDVRADPLGAIWRRPAGGMWSPLP